jgi:hypothetical protein
MVSLLYYACYIHRFFASITWYVHKVSFFVNLLKNTELLMSSESLYMKIIMNHKLFLKTVVSIQFLSKLNMALL